MPATGERGNKDMNRKTIYSDAPQELGEVLAVGKKVVDLLPPPEQLVRRTPKVKVTITLNSRSVEFFKKFAKTNHVKYQTMINEVLDQYANKYNSQSEK